jgi:hypothetical protein
VGVAGLGVVAVFQIANFVAAGTGRTIMAGRESGEKGNTDPAMAEAILKNQDKQQ